MDDNKKQELENVLMRASAHAEEAREALQEAEDLLGYPKGHDGVYRGVCVTDARGAAEELCRVIDNAMDQKG